MLYYTKIPENRCLKTRRNNVIHIHASIEFSRTKPLYFTQKGQKVA
jgi:hypothetical protein